MLNPLSSKLNRYALPRHRGKFFEAKGQLPSGDVWLNAGPAAATFGHELPN